MKILVKFFFSLLLVTFLYNVSIAQEITDKQKSKKEKIVRAKFIGVESGIDFLSSTIPDYDFIRGDITYYGAEVSESHLSGFFQKWYTGVNFEIRSNNEKFGLLGGLRYISTNSSLGKNSYWESSSDYFLLLLEQDGTSTQFLRVNEINNTVNYVGIPIEIRFFPTRPRLFQLYFKAAIEFNSLINFDSEVIFETDEMVVYETEVLNKFDDPDDFYSIGYAGVGFNLNIKNRFMVNFEATVPSIVLYSYSTGIIEPEFGGGFRLCIQIPL